VSRLLGAPSSLALLRSRLTLPMTRRVVGLMEGRHRSTLHGHGQDFDDLSLYTPGDDVNDIDWRSSARAGVPLIKRYVHDTTITVILAIDTGRTMSAQARDGQTKAEVAVEVARLIALLTHDSADRMALVAGDTERLVTRAGRHGRTYSETLMRLVERAFATESPEQGPASDIPRLVDHVSRVFTRRSLVVLITDDAHPDADHDPAEGEGPDTAALRRLRAQHDLLVVSVADADPLTAAGTDIDDGWVVPAQLRHDPALRDAAAQYAEVRAERRRQGLTRLDTPSATIGHTRDVLRGLARALEEGHARR
jgi:uncharacterized protein (DUF58 family)